MPDERDVIPAASALDRLRILTTNKTVAIVGLSPDPMRPSHFVAIYLMAEGYDVIPVNPRAAGTTILGRPVYGALSEIPRPVDIVDVFRKAADCPPIAREAIKIGAKVLWLQLGITSPESEAIARAGGLEYVENRCLKIEHARFFGGLNLVGMNTGVITSRRSIV